MWRVIAIGVTVSIHCILTAATIPSEVKETVTFIFRPAQRGDLTFDGSGSLRQAQEGEPVPNGTGFFVGVKNEKNPLAFNTYLVTAKHVLQDQRGQLFSTIWVRLNKLKGGAEFVSLDLAAVERAGQIYNHPTDNTVDISVVPILPKQDTFAFKYIPDDLLTTKESFKALNIMEGSDVFFTGLFLNYYGQERNHPIVRFGKVALMSDERVFWKEGGNPPEMLELYLVETQSYGGNSGSPVFFYLGSDRVPGAVIAGPPVLKLAGVMKGSFNEPRMLGLAQQNNANVSFSLQNLGIAAVVPSYLLHEILFSNGPKANREQYTGLK